MTGRNQVESVSVVGQAVAVRLAGVASSAVISYQSGIDSMIAHIQRELGLFGLGMKTYVIASLCIDHAAISRCRHGQALQESWLLRAHEWSGIPVAELRLVAGLGAGVPQHKNARPSRPVAGE